jgi:hypothetical protein
MLKVGHRDLSLVEHNRLLDDSDYQILGTPGSVL